MRLAAWLGGTSLVCLLAGLSVALVPPGSSRRGAVSADSLPALQPQREPPVDGDLKLDAQQHLVIDMGLRDYFDYFLSAADRIGLDRATSLLLEDADGRLDEPALGQLQQVLGDYLDYRQARQALIEHRPSLAAQRDPHVQREALRQEASQLASLRRQYLDEAVVQAFFGAEEAYSRFTLAILEVQLRTDLEPAQKIQALERLRAQLPEEARESGGRHGRALGVQAEIDRLLRAGVSDQDLRGFLGRHYDTPTVERLLAEQRQERQWRTRYGDYRRKVQALRAEGMQGAELLWRMRELRRQMFSGEDLLRVEHYDAFANNKNEASR